VRSCVERGAPGCAWAAAGRICRKGCSAHAVAARRQLACSRGGLAAAGQVQPSTGGRGGCVSLNASDSLWCNSSIVPCMHRRLGRGAAGARYRAAGARCRAAGVPGGRLPAGGGRQQGGPAAPPHPPGAPGGAEYVQGVGFRVVAANKADLLPHHIPRARLEVRKVVRV
jgi:hypothetical protein